MVTRRFSSDDGELDLLYKEFAEQDLQPLWELHGLLTAQPAVRAVPYVWRFAELTALAARAGELVGIDRGGDRRVLACANPGLDGAPYAVGTLWAAVQYLQPGEVAPAHRHTVGALRFILEGDGVWTQVDGDAIAMAAGDLVLTPGWTFHEHHNSGSVPMMWLDVLDLPIVAAMDAVFYEDGPSDDVEITTPASSRSERAYGAGPGIVPARGRREQLASPLLAYRWVDTDRALRDQLADGESYAHVRYTNPTTGGDVLPTMRCEVLRVPAGVRTLPARQTGGRVAAVLHGTGTITVGDRVFDVSPGDIIAVPSWFAMWVAADEEIDLFFTSDAPAQSALGLYREQAEQ